MAVVAALFASLFLAASPAAAQDGDSCAIDITDYEGSASITIDNLQPQAGDTVTFVGSGFPPGTTVPLAANGESIGSPTTDASGGFSFAYTIPADLPVGTTLEFSATCGAFVLLQTITISAAGPAPTPTPGPTPQPLPVTGADYDWAIRLGLALVVVGGLVLLAVRRRDAVPTTV